MTRHPDALSSLLDFEPLPLDRKKDAEYSKLAMKRFGLPRTAYAFFLLAEFVKIALLSGAVFSAGGGGVTMRSVFEHAGLAALCLAPVMLFMLICDERAFAFCLPLLAIGKGASLLSFAFLLVRAAGSVSFEAPQVSNFRAVFCAIIISVVEDLALLIFCLWRRRKICG